MKITYFLKLICTNEVSVFNLPFELIVRLWFGVLILLSQPLEIPHRFLVVSFLFNEFLFLLFNFLDFT